jgi:hypothetical protein
MLTYRARNLGTDEAQSFTQLAMLLQRVAPHTPFGGFIARTIARRYYCALANRTEETLREQLWREFLVALNAFLGLPVRGSQAELDILRSIVAENADLLLGPNKQLRHKQAPCSVPSDRGDRSNA